MFITAWRLGIAIVLVSGRWLEPPLAWPAEHDLADPTRQPGGINPAEIDWRCSIMAGREDRAYLHCQSTVGEMTGTLVDTRFKIDPSSRARHPAYEEYGAGGRSGIGPLGPRRR
jgi:hypothetical protein